MRETSADATYSDGGRNGWAMDVSCPKCERRLWAEKVSATDTFSAWVFFDNEERSDTYATSVWRCPGCGCGLRGCGLRDRVVVTDVLERDTSIRP